MDGCIQVDLLAGTLAENWRILLQ